MVNPRKATVSPRLLRRPWCWRKRIPIPFITQISDEGVVDFVGENRKRIDECAKKRLCQFCGTRLEAVIVFMGGEEAVRSKLFRQGPFHEECARLALVFCTYLRSRMDRQHMFFARDYRYAPAIFPYSRGGTVTKAFQARGHVRTEAIDVDPDAPPNLAPWGW
jgi:hypothetical protein